MPKFLMLECYGDFEDEPFDVESPADELDWMLGRRFTGAVPSPVRISMSSEGGVRLPVYKQGILVIRDDVIAALEDAGVDNLDTYAAEIINTATGERHENYKAVNVIGLVAAADMSKSTYQAHGAPVIDVDFESVSIDDSKHYDLLMFRLAENVSAVVVHERVKAHLDAAGISDIDWVEPESWVG